MARQSAGQKFALLAITKSQPSAAAVELARHQGGMARARHPSRLEALVEVPGRGIAQIVHRHVVERRVEVHSPAGRARPHDAGDQRQRGGEPAHEIDDREAEAGRHAVRLAGHGEVAGLGLHHIVEAGPGGALVVAAVGREVHADEARVDGGEAPVVEPERTRQVAAQVVDEGVGAPRQALQDLAAARLLEVQRQAALVAAEGLVEEAVAVPGIGEDVAAHLAAAAGGSRS